LEKVRATSLLEYYEELIKIGKKCIKVEACMDSSAGKEDF